MDQVKLKKCKLFLNDKIGLLALALGVGIQFTDQRFWWAFFCLTVISIHTLSQGKEYTFDSWEDLHELHTIKFALKHFTVYFLGLSALGYHLIF